MHAKPLSILGGISLHAATCFNPSAALVCLFAGGLWGVYCWRRRSPLIAYILIGYLYSALHAAWVLDHQLPVRQSGDLFWIEGPVSQLSQRQTGPLSRRSFVLSEPLAHTYAGRRRALQNIRVTSFGKFAPRLQQWCAFYARLKAPRGTRNPGGPHHERRYFAKRISALAYVVDHPRNHCIANPRSSRLQRAHGTILAAFAQSEIEPESKAVLSALSVAERAALSDEQWQVFRRTGTAHLLAISGLHVSFVAGAAFFVLRSLLLLMAKRWGSTPIYRCSLLVGLTVAVCYAGLAGFSLPTQRALVVVFVATIGLLRVQPALSSQTLLGAALVVLLLDPLALLMPGFWLSFSAVGILLLMRAMRPADGWLLSTLKTHCLMSIGTLPLVMSFTEILPLSAPLANFIAVPVTCFGIVPLVLTGVVLALFEHSWCEPSWQAAAAVWEYLWALLRWLSDHSPAPRLAHTPQAVQLGMLAVGVGILLIPVIPRRWLFVGVCCAQLLFHPRERLREGEWRLTALDVGQGLALIVETDAHVLVYDTGPAFGDYSAGATIVAQTLRYFGHRRVDRVVISHGDNDHAGGLHGLAERLSLDSVITPAGAVMKPAVRQCRAGQRWRWDGVEFAMLAPTAQSVGSENDLSCVLKITSVYGQAILPGDIEAATETALMQELPEQLRAQILIAPHHGSTTSSTPEFVHAVAPDYVVYAAGYRNRFGFPHGEVTKRYDALGAVSYTTGIHGAVQFAVLKSGIHTRTERDAKHGSNDAF